MPTLRSPGPAHAAAIAAGSSSAEPLAWPAAEGAAETLLVVWSRALYASA